MGVLGIKGYDSFPHGSEALSPHGLILLGLRQLWKERKAKKAKEMELLINMSLKGLTRKQAVYRLEFWD